VLNWQRSSLLNLKHKKELSLIRTFQIKIEMKGSNLKNKNAEHDTPQPIAIKVIAVSLVLVLVLVVPIAIYALLTKDNNGVLIALALCCSGLLTVQFISKKNKNELKNKAF
jgi:amino acid transporter